VLLLTNEPGRHDCLNTSHHD